MGHPIKLHSRLWYSIVFGLVLVAAAGCTSGTPTSGPSSGLTPNSGGAGTATPTPSLSSTPSVTPSPTQTSTPTATPTETATPTPTQPTTGGPYVVEQTKTLGGEKISGLVCSLTAPFRVSSVTPKVSFNFLFVPADADHGQVSYAYSIPSAGESHDATGTYQIKAIPGSNKLSLSLQVSDHVVFHGFDGKIPLFYGFNLVPTGSTPCP